MTSSLLQSLNIATVQVVTALFVQTCFVLGTVTSVGVFFSEFKETLGITSSAIGISLGLFNAFTFGPGPIVAKLYRRRRLRRPMLITGSILAPLGLLASSTASNNVHLALSLSLAGLGGNMLSQCLVICLDVHAHEYFYTLFGISKSGYAFGMLISPLLAAYLMQIYGWRGAMLIIGAITSHIIPLTSMVDTTIPYNSGHLDPSDSPKYNNRSGERSVEERQRGDYLNKGCPSVLNKTTVESANVSVLPQTEHCQASFSGAVQPSDGELQNASGQHYEESSGNRSTAAVGVSSQDICIESCSLMDMNHNSHPQTKGIQQHETVNLTWSDNDHLSSDTSSKLSLKRIRQSLKDSIYSEDKCFIIIIIANSFVAMVHGGWHSFFIPRALSRGKSLYATQCLLYSTSVACFVSRIFSGVLLNPPLISAYDLFLLMRIVNTASMLADIYFSSFTTMLVLSFMTSFAINEGNMFMLFVSKERSPRSAFPQVFAVIQIAFGIGALLGTYLTGMFADITGSYNVSFMFLLSVEGAIFLMMIPPRFIRSKFQEESENPE